MAADRRKKLLLSNPVAAALLLSLFSCSNAWTSTISTVSKQTVDYGSRYKCTSTSLHESLQTGDIANGTDDSDNLENIHQDSIVRRDIVVISWDGCLVSTTQRNIKLGLKAAYIVWPELELMTMGADLTWLYNKLEALRHVLAPVEDGYHPAVEYALAIRMLLEEQELDEGKSNGSKGKYGSKFHPSAECEAFPVRRTSGTRRGQRPLTVGEISANWRELLREAAWIRYFQEEGEDPLSLLHQAITEEGSEDLGQTLPFLEEVALSPIFARNRADSLFRGGIVVGVYHKSDLEPAKASLKHAGLCPVECHGPLESMRVVGKDQVALTILNRSSVKNLLQASPPQSTIRVLESYWSRLQDLVPLFGDSIPRFSGIGKCGAVPDRFLQLALCEWNAHPNDISAATMNAWTTTVASARASICPPK